MNISLDKKTNVSALLNVEIVAADYQEAVEKALKNFRKNANIPGFRKGMVPMGLIKRQYGEAAKAEEVNKLLQNKVFDYIRENKDFIAVTQVKVSETFVAEGVDFTRDNKAVGPNFY